MTKLTSLTLIILALLLLTFQGAKAQDRGDLPMRIRLTFGNQTLIIKMDNNATTRQLMAQLPQTLEFRDYAGCEKIANLQRPLSLAGAPRGLVAKAGKMFIFAPWGNLGFFYKNNGILPDQNLIPLGEIESGLELLTKTPHNFTATLQTIEE